MGKSHSHIMKTGAKAHPKKTVGYKDIIISQHAKFRCLERVPSHILPHYTIAEVRKLAARARQSGVNISYMNRLSDKDLLKLDITKAQAETIYEKYLKSMEKMHSCKCYFYRYFIFFFAGNGSKTLVSVIPGLPSGDMEIVLDLNHIPLKNYENMIAEV